MLQLVIVVLLVDYLQDLEFQLLVAVAVVLALVAVHHQIWMAVTEAQVAVAVVAMFLEDQTLQTGMAQEELHLMALAEDLVEMVQMLVVVVVLVVLEALE
jgi:hypothetical protein